MPSFNKNFPGVYTRFGSIKKTVVEAEPTPPIERTGPPPPAPPTPPTPPPAGQVATPQFNPTGETFNGSVDVTITCATAGASIYYTTDGSTPTTGSTPYSGPVHLTATTNLQAIGHKTGMTDSGIASDNYTLSLDCPIATTLPALDFPLSLTGSDGSSPPGIGRPSWAAVNSNNVICYLDDYGPKIYFVDQLTNTLITSLTVGSGFGDQTSSIVYDSKNNLFIVQQWRSIVFVDGTLFTEISRITNLLGTSSGDVPRLLAYDPVTGHTFAISYRNANSLFIIDGATRSVIHTVTMPHVYDSIIWLPNISRCFLTRGFVLGEYYNPVGDVFTTSAVAAGESTHYEALYHSGTGYMLVGCGGAGNFVRIINVTTDTQVGILGGGVQQLQDLVVNTCNGETWIADQGSRLLFEFNSDMSVLIATFVVADPVGLTFCRRTNLVYGIDDHFDMVNFNYGLHQSVTYPTTDQTDPLYTLEQLGFSSFGNIPDVTEITLNVISTIPGIDIEGNTTLQKLHCPFLVSIDPTNQQSGYLLITGCSVLTTVELPVFVPTSGGTYDLSNNALNAATVNQFLARCVLNPIFIGGTINLNGGTNSAPTGQGLTDKATLQGRGVTVNTN